MGEEGWGDPFRRRGERVRRARQGQDGKGGEERERGEGERGERGRGLGAGERGRARAVPFAPGPPPIFPLHLTAPYPPILPLHSITPFCTYPPIPPRTLLHLIAPYPPTPFRRSAKALRALPTLAAALKDDLLIEATAPLADKGAGPSKAPPSGPSVEPESSVAAIDIVL